MKTLKLFNAVLAKGKKKKPFVAEAGYIIEPAARWAEEEIINYYAAEALNGNDLNKTFHKSWQKIKDSTRGELLVEQIMHYLSTYGTNFQAETYIPNEILDLPDVKLKFKVIKAYTKEELIEKSLYMLQSGIALKEETVDDLITVLVDELDYTFTGKEGIRNKEAIVKIAEAYQVFPENPVEFFRYIIYRTTNTTLLIKSKELIAEIKGSSYNPTTAFKAYGLERLAEIFNRFKPLFLAYKGRAPKTINRISKLSKTYHKPMKINALSEITQRKLKKDDIGWLENATIYALFKALAACYTRKQGQESFLFRIRNGKSWVADAKFKKSVVKHNYKFIMDFMKGKFSLEGTKIYVPKGVKYALPTSEKMFVGNVPTGTKFIGDKLAAGIYWENAWGATDLDLSGENIGGKIGWNSTYNQGSGSLMYSGDITNSPSGAVEYLYANKGLNTPTLVLNNVYSGQNDCKYKIIVGKGDKMSRDYMMNPENLFAEITCEGVQKQMILGILIPEKLKQSFVLLNFGSGNARVSGHSEISTLATKALYEQWSNPLTFKQVAKALGAEFVKKPKKADNDLSLDVLERDTFINLFKTK